MYNRYIPQDEFRPVDDSGPGAHPGGKEGASASLRRLLERLRAPGGGGGLGELLRSFRLESLDKGDILLILIILYLFWEGDDTELLITLGLLLLLGL